MRQTPLRGIEAALFIISAVGIAFQIALMRVLSIAQWSHFAHLILSTAMLGFGASGAFLALARERFRGHEITWLRASCLALIFALPVCHWLSQAIPFETMLLPTDARQFLYLFLLYLTLSAPFFLAATCIALGLMLAGDRVGRVYGGVMLGSGAGAAGMVVLLYTLHPADTPMALALVTAVAHALLRLGAPQGRRWGAAPLLVLVLIAVLGPDRVQRVSEYKDLSYTLDFPDAEILCEKTSPFSVLTAVESELIRATPGQVSNYPMSEYGPFPPQIGLFFDAGAMSEVNKAEGFPERFAFLDYVTAAAAYRLVEKPRAAILGAGGGTGVYSALWHGARHVTAIEVDPGVLEVMRGELREWTGGLYDRADVETVLDEGRGFLTRTDQRFDLIQLPLFGSFNATAGGVHALNESNLYTVESLRLCLERLTPGGVLLINVWLQTPPRDAIKMFATAAEALEAFGVQTPGAHLAFIRSWNNAAILATREPLSPQRIGAIRAFCAARQFDLDYLPGLQESEVNRYTILDEPTYYRAALAILSPEREAFYRDYLFNIQPATDNRPYFFQFFKWRSLSRFIEGMRAGWLPIVEWGYLILAASLVQSLLAGAVIILAPLIVLSRKRAPRGARLWTVLYFAALGFAYMFLEMASIQLFMRLLAYPVYAVSVVLTGFLVFSGLGSLYSARFSPAPRRGVSIAAGCAAVIAILYLFVLPPLFDAAAGASYSMRIAISLALIAPLAFAMGMPFPLGLRLLGARAEALLPWAWGINGCASVTATALAVLGAIHFGFTAVLTAAALLYLGAALAMRRLSESL